jgi:hypothetical protein
MINRRAIARRPGLIVIDEGAKELDIGRRPRSAQPLRPFGRFWYSAHMIEDAP